MSHLMFAVIAFVGGHVLISGTGLRAILISRIGEKAFRGLFSVFALSTLVWVVMAYRAAPMIVVWDPPPGLRWLTLVLVAFAVWLVVASVTRSSQRSMANDDGRKTADAAGGVLAITRHPMMWGIVSWAVGHLLARGDQASLLLFGGIAILAIAGSLSQDRKQRARAGDDWASYANATSHVPFAAIATGRAKLKPSEIGWLSPIIALVVFVGLIAAHQWAFGVSPLPG